MSYKGYTNIWWVSSILNEYASLMTEYQADGIEDIMGGTAKYLEQAIDKILKLPMNKELLKNEPDGLDEIKALRAGGKRAYCEGLPENYEDRLAGALLGRIAGCLLGSIVEGYEILPRLTAMNFPRPIIGPKRPEPPERFVTGKAR